MPLVRGRLQIILDSPDVVVHGPPREAPCTVLSGRVVYATRSPRPVASLVVRFRPKHEELFNPALSVACQPEVCCVVVKDGRVDPASAELAYDSVAGQQGWQFSISIPGSTSETVFTPSAFIAYELAAELRTSSLAHLAPFCRQTCVMPIAVKRLPAAASVWAAVTGAPLDVSETWRGRLAMSVAARSRVVHDGQHVRITGLLRPLVKGLSLLRTAFELCESADGPFDCCGENPQRGNAVAMCARDLRLPTAGNGPEAVRVRCLYPPTAARRRPGIAIDQEIEVAGSLSVPAAYRSVQYDIAVGPVRVSHELAFVATVVDEGGHVHTMRLSTGVYVFPRSSGPEVDLPRYEHVAKDILLAAGEHGMQIGSTYEPELSSPHAERGHRYRASDGLPPAYSRTCPGQAAALDAVPYAAAHLVDGGSGSNSSNSGTLV